MHLVGASLQVCQSPKHNSLKGQHMTTEYAYTLETTTTISVGGGKDMNGNKRVAVKTDVPTTLGYIANCDRIRGGATLARRGEAEGHDDAVTAGEAVHDAGRKANMPHAKELARQAAAESDPIKSAALLKLALKGYAPKLRLSKYDARRSMNG